MLDFFKIFIIVFFAELGDKNQLATLLFASDPRRSSLLVFLAASLALLLSTAIPAFVGKVAGDYLSRVPLQLISGVVFTAVGLWTILNYYRGVPD
jgi:putative Ca2+/H+ antiporter (TMEM165/GDT1 family)